ncbi:MAG: hypothetical protein GEU73_14480 [Chloroflexi bacterium]|nr:hypothetical protein [Chloroflexota bacterium]
MAKFHPTPPTWSDDVKGYDWPTKTLYGYILSNPHKNSEGLYRLPCAYVVHDLDMDEVLFDKGLTDLQAAGLVKYDFAAQVILDVKGLHILPPGSAKQVDGAISKLKQVPETALMLDLLELARIHAPELAERMPREIPCLMNVSPNTSETLANQVHRDRQLGDGDDVGSSALEVVTPDSAAVCETCGEHKGYCTCTEAGVA